ncbi:MAG: hypothetical protein U1F87_18110 [Kiritimatiellia bacterium]
MKAVLLTACCAPCRRRGRPARAAAPAISTLWWAAGFGAVRRNRRGKSQAREREAAWTEEIALLEAENSAAEGDGGV